MRLIDADNVIKKLREHKKLFCRNQTEFRMLPPDQKARVDEIDACIGELMNAKPIDTEPPRGRWKNEGKVRAFDVFGNETFGVKRKCTNCGFVHIFIEDHGHYPYCPICRADME